MKLVSIFVFFTQRIYGVNFKRIDNGPQCAKSIISTITVREISKKPKIGAGDFL